jgi:hypothetical protein
MTFETTSLLLNWMEMGALLAILFRLSSTFNLIANTQRELRRAIHHLGERPGDELGTDTLSVGRGSRRLPDPRIRVASAESTVGAEDLAYLPF